MAFATVSVAAMPAMRLDYYHTGDATSEVFSVDRVVIEPLPWPGHPSQAIDSSNLGKYLFEVRDAKTKQLLYSRGFASIYGEWETTDEAKTIKRTFQESLRFPAPTAPVSIVLKKRDAKNVFQDIWTTTIDPADQFVDRSKPVAPAPLITIQKTGEPEDRVDFLILGDGYTAAEAKKFEADARRLTDTLFATSPFKENRRSFNVWALCPPAAESGISRPSTGIYRDSPLGATYDAFGSERYVLTFDIARCAVLHNSRRTNLSKCSLTVALTVAAASSIFTAPSLPTTRSPITSLYTSLGITSPDSPTNTTRRQSLTLLQPIESSRGNRTSPRCWTSAH